MARAFGIKGTRLDIHWAKVDTYPAPGRPVGKFTRRIATETEVIAGVLTSAGTYKYGRGVLAKSYGTSRGAVTTTRCTYVVSNSQPYAAFVFRGTQTPVAGKGKKKMPVGKSQLGLPPGSRATKGTRFTFRRKVRGQRGNNYPMRAVRTVFVRRGL